MTGYIDFNNCLSFFTYQDGFLTIYQERNLNLKYYSVAEDDLCKSEKIKYIIGFDLVTHKKVIFIVKDFPLNTSLGLGKVEIIEVYAYISYNIEDIIPISSIRFFGSEINYFYSNRNGCVFRHNEDNKFYVLPIKFNENKEEFVFCYNNEDIEAEIGVKYNLRTNSTEPLSLKSCFILSFDKTTSIDKILDLHRIMLLFFYFICYRKNISLEDMELYGVDDVTGANLPVATMHYNYVYDSYEDGIVAQEMPDYYMMKSHIADIFNEIVSGKLYTQHIPLNYKDGTIITPARFVLTTAAFEWNVRQLYNISISEKQKKVKQDILSAIENVPNTLEYNGDLKKKFKSFEKFINNYDSGLSDKITHVLNDLDNVLKIFISDLYKRNNKELSSYPSMGERLQTQRNNYAHGNIDKEMNFDVILDIIVLEWVNHSIILKKVGYEEKEITKIINAIFKRNFSL